MNEELRKFVEENPKLVTRRESTRYPGLFVIKYTRKVFYDALWNDTLEECRGLVLDKDWNTVVMPFRKIYNRGERGTDFPLDTRVCCVGKVNGFMAAATHHHTHGTIISTTGSLDSPFVELAEKWLDKSKPWFAKTYGITFLFEICDPTDPHIIQEIPGAYLIGARYTDSGLMALEHTLDTWQADAGFQWLRPSWSIMDFEWAVTLAKRTKSEGYVVHELGNPAKSLKMKSPYYLVTKFLARMRSDKFLDRIEDPTLRQTIAEEYYPLLDDLKANKVFFADLNEAGKVDYIRHFLEHS